MILHVLQEPFVWRCGGAFLISFLLFLILGKKFIRWLGKGGMVDYFRLYSPLSHKSKKGTPSGGGVFILFCIGISSLLLGDVFNQYLQIALLATFCFGFIGLVDDAVKRLRKSSRGLSIRSKLLFQLVASVFVVIFVYYSFAKAATQVTIPFTHFQIELGIFYLPLAVFIILGSSNAVNLTDGLDGLAAGCMIAPAAVFIIISLFQRSTDKASFLNMIYLPESRELAFFWCALLGAILGFLRYNRFPALLFMGGVGAEALGAALGVSAILLKEELLLLLIGGVFVIEALSVVLQVLSFRLMGKRIFKMTPIHHHFELNGARETRIVKSFWMASALFSAVAFLDIIYF